MYRWTDEYLEVNNNKYFQERYLQYNNGKITDVYHKAKLFKKISESDNYAIYCCKVMINIKRVHRHREAYSMHPDEAFKLCYYIVKKDSDKVFHILDRSREYTFYPQELSELCRYLEDGEKNIPLNLY